MGIVHVTRWITASAVALSLALLVAPGSAGAEPLDVAAAADRVEPSVVRIDTIVDYQHILGTGTGIVLDVRTGEIVRAVDPHANHEGRATRGRAGDDVRGLATGLE